MRVTQKHFARAVLDPLAPVPDGLIGPGGRAAGRRFDVYRNNVVHSLGEALRVAFPAVHALLGEANFKGLAGLFVRSHPPRTPVLMLYGDELPGFLEDLPQVAHLPYLPDIARIDLARRQAYHAADAPVLEPQALACDADSLMRARISLHPSLRVIRSRWPVDEIWRFAMIPDAPKPGGDGQTVLITRPGYDPVQTTLPSGAAAFLRALDDGMAFGTAADTAAAAAADFVLSDTLAACLAAGAFSSLRTDRP